ncbi:MAG TPA: CapA family protein [Candidatus Saccharimonadales bacterium]|nr:CapA family protein [Candidatus Saccharimonadales bacterium]
MRWTGRRSAHRPRRWLWVVGCVVLLLAAAGGLTYHFAARKPAAYTAAHMAGASSALHFDASVSADERQLIATTLQQHGVGGALDISVQTTLEQTAGAALAAYVPVTNAYAPRQSISRGELAHTAVFVPAGSDAATRSALATALGVPTANLQPTTTPAAETKDADVLFIPATQLTPKVKLLALDGAYYLDSFQKGAVFRQAVFHGAAAGKASGVQLGGLPTKDAVLKVNMSGVTALTRVFMKKLSSVKDPTYFSQKIGPFLADADITHTSDEVSFEPGCQYNITVFCALPEMIGPLKASGIDVVELTGNHNNDAGTKNDTDTINLYHSLGWHTFGGGLNSAEAAKPYIADQKGSKVAFLGYNYADSPHGTPIATADGPGANSFDFDKIQADIAAAKQQAGFVIVDVQYNECYAYPDGYVPYPICYQPIKNQTADFRKIIDLGADMVVGTQAHQPQTYELYHGKPIYYGLGNLYFEQTQWPDTEEGMILTHYFVKGQLLQTKLSPTLYDTALQTHLTTDAQAVDFLGKLEAARQAAGL